MAPTTTPIPPPIIPPHPKPKRPVPAGIQTNGLASSSSPSPLMSAKKPPNSAKQSVKVAASNGGTVTVARPNIHVRSEITALPNGHVRSSISAASAAPPAPTSAIEPAVVPVIPEQHPNPKYILKKFVGNRPSLVVHMHANHFKFDSQDDYFLYTSPMRSFIEHLEAKTIPHDMMADLNEAEVPFYEGCLIIEIHNHRPASTEEKEDARPSSRSKDDVPNSIHKYNRYITPSPSRPFPRDAVDGANGHAKKATDPQQGNLASTSDQGNSSVNGSPQSQKMKPPPSVKVYTVVLFPTQQSRQADLALKACNPRGPVDCAATNGVPPTPSTAVPPTPTGSCMPPPAKKVKRESMELDSGNIYEVEGKMLLGSLPPLDLEPTRDALGTLALLDKQAEEVKHRLHPAPMPKERKRTVAEMAAEEAQAAGKERYLLVLDERNGQGGSSVPGGDGQQQVQPFDATFERFKKIEEIKREHTEKAQQEKLQQAEKERALQERKQQLAREQAEERSRDAEQRAASNQANQANHASQQDILRRRNLVAMQAQQRQAAAGMGQTPHGHPMANASVNGMPVSLPASAPNGMSMANGRLQGGVSQPTASSPLVRQNTPQNMSSPMVGSVAMQASGSSIGAGSPARPPSVVNQQPMAAPMAVSMSARGSQQSHAGTPRMPHLTPNMAHASPTSRAPMMNTPRMTQASPPPNMTAPQMQPQMMMPNPGIVHLNTTPAAAHTYAAAQVVQTQRSIQQANINSMGAMPQQQHLIQQQQQQRMRAAQAQAQHQRLLAQYPQFANNPQALQQYVRQQQQQSQQQQQAQAQAQAYQRQQQGANSGFQNQPTQQHAVQMRHMQMMAAQQQAQQLAVAQAQQMGQAGQQPAQAGQQQMTAQQAQHAMQSQVSPLFTNIFNSKLPHFLAQVGAHSIDAVPQQQLQTFKDGCLDMAKNQILRQVHLRRQHQLQQQQQHQLQLQQQQQQQQIPQQMTPQQAQQQQIIYNQRLIQQANMMAGQNPAANPHMMSQQQGL